MRFTTCEIKNKNKAFCTTICCWCKGQLAAPHNKFARVVAGDVLQGNIIL